MSVASIPGRTFEFHDLETLSEGKESLDDIVDGLISAGFIEEERGSRGEVLTFSSGIVRDVLYGQIPRRRRRALHRKYAEELEARNAGHLERFYSALVHHYSEGDVPEKVIEYGMEQIRKSLDAFSPDDALRSAKVVLEFVQGESDAATLLEGQVRSLVADAHRMAGNIDATLQELGAGDRNLRAIRETGKRSWRCGPGGRNCMGRTANRRNAELGTEGTGSCSFCWRRRSTGSVESPFAWGHRCQSAR